MQRFQYIVLNVVFVLVLIYIEYLKIQRGDDEQGNYFWCARFS